MARESGRGLELRNWSSVFALPYLTPAAPRNPISIIYDGVRLLSLLTLSPPCYPSKTVSLFWVGSAATRARLESSRRWPEHTVHTVRQSAGYVERVSVTVVALRCPSLAASAMVLNDEFPAFLLLWTFVLIDSRAPMMDARCDGNLPPCMGRFTHLSSFVTRLVMMGFVAEAVCF